MPTSTLASSSRGGQQMKLGVGMPQMMPRGLDRQLFLEWVQLADRAGFASLAAIDHANYDSWEVLASLAAAATVTERVRLTTTVLALPQRNEVEVAKQAAVIDQLSGGRLELGVGIGTRPDDFELLGAQWAGRGPRLRQQVARLREIWTQARESTADLGVNGPAPVQEPGIPILVGAASEAAIKRAVEIGDGFVFGSLHSLPLVAEMLPKLRRQAAALGKPGFRFYKLQYCAVGDPGKIMPQAAQELLRYYRKPDLPYDLMLTCGPTAKLADYARAAAGTGIDLLIYIPAILDPEQVGRIAEDVLPDHLEAEIPAGSSIFEGAAG